MSATESIAVLRGHLAQTREVLADIDTYYRDFRERELPADDFDRFLIRLSHDS